MGTTIYRVTGIGLAVTIALLGAGVSILLYYAGKAAIDLFYTNSMYTDEHNRINRRMPTDNWYGELVLRGWAFGFLYVVPGLSGITSSLFFNKCLMGVHIAIAILSLVIGSFLHTAGAMAIILYRVMVVEGASRYNPWLGDCIYVRDNAAIPYEFVDERCLAGRHALMLAIATNCVMFIAWIFVLADLLYIGFTFHNIGKPKKEVKPERPRPRRPRPHRNITRTSNEMETLPKVELTNEERGTTEDTANIVPSETQDVNATNSTTDTTETTENVATVFVEGNANVVLPETQVVDSTNGTEDTAQITETEATGGTVFVEDTTNVVSPDTQYFDTTGGTVDNTLSTETGATEDVVGLEDTAKVVPHKAQDVDISSVKVDIAQKLESENFN